jgi:hypothetical protein
MKTWSTCITCVIRKATNTASECVIIIAFPLQQWLHGRASVSCLVIEANGTCIIHCASKHYVNRAALHSLLGKIVCSSSTK